MTVGIAGLGLIGGSFAKAYSEAGWRVLGYNRSESVLEFAMLSGAVDAPLTKDNIAECDIVLVALYPKACIDYIKEMAPYIGAGPVVLDCGGTKRDICAELFPFAAESGIRFFGGHPMAGTHNSGFKYARSNMFHGASMVVVPPAMDDIETLGRIEELLAPAGFGRFSVTTAAEHDAMIAFTSQMPHVISNAYIKSPTARSHKGFSAGSYKDMTRVARLAPAMWSELFLENGDNLLAEIDILIKELSRYRDAISRADADGLTELLAEGSRIKEEVDGR